jgi:GxxExxY protein
MNADQGGLTQTDELSEKVIGAIFEVSNTLGAGFLEKVYERALLRELGLLGVKAVGQASMPVIYKGRLVGDYFADILVEDQLVVELKCVERLSREHTAQCLNYLRASGKNVCLLVNFEKPKVEWRRVVSGVHT